MARIMKIRAVPRGYVKTEGMSIENHSPSEWFMALYGKLGNPQDGGIWSYMIRHNNVVIKFVANDSETMEYQVWVSPGLMQEAKRKRTRVVNIIARRLNEEGRVFVSDNEPLYYVVRMKNEELMRRNGSDDLRKKMDEVLTADERHAIYGGWAQYLTEAQKEIDNTIKELFE